MKIWQQVIAVLLVLIILLTNSIQPTTAQSNFPNCRFGVGGAFGPYVGDYDIAQLNIGRYLDWWSRGNPYSGRGLPTNVEYLQVVRVHQDKVGGWNSDYVEPPSYTIAPNLNTITNNAINQPGSIWFIGNEIERRDWNGGHQDEITPELYATAFHEIQQAIKQADPTAQIGIGSIIQTTPLRLKYLDRVWDSYMAQFGYSMGQDIDVWNIHIFILREKRNSWGAEIPAGFDNADNDPTNDYAPSEGFLYNANYSTMIAEHHNIERFKEFTRIARQWMADHGERNKPLINTEYGILLTDVTSQQVRDFMVDSFDYMLSATDENIGYPADENRLVQSWVWYSLNDEYFDGNLFDPDTKALTTFGTTWKNYVTDAANPLASQSQQNLLVTNTRTVPAYYIKPTQAVSFTLQVDVANSGNSPTMTGDQIAVSFWDGPPDTPGSMQIGATQMIADLPGCGRVTTAEVEWPNRTEQTNDWYVQVETITGETNTTDNVTSDSGTIHLTQPQAELSLTKTVDQSQPLERFEKINYTLSVNNPGPDTSLDLVVNDTLPPGLTFKGYQTTHGTYFSSGAWFVGDLAATATALLTITASVEKGWAGQTITNTAFISSTDSLDLDNKDNQASVSIEPLPIYDVYLPTVMK